MGQRGRPPYPDILTPRQWEVLDLLRDGLSDQQIADRLEITLAGAKYHVSEILSKLGVASREAAAAWQPPAEPAPPWWQRAITLSLAWKIAATVVVVAAGIVFASHSWDSAEMGDEIQAPVFDDLDLPTPVTPPMKTHDEVLMDSVFGGSVSAVDIRVTTVAGIYQQFGRPYSGWQHHNGFPRDPADESTAWLVRARVWRDCDPVLKKCPSPAQSEIGCKGSITAILDITPAENLPGIVAWATTDRDTSEADADCFGIISRDVAVVRARSAVNLNRVIPDDKGAQVGARRMTLGDGLEALRAAGFIMVSNGNLRSSVWLVTFQGRYIGSATDTTSPAPATPSVTPRCHLAAAIVDESGTVLFADSTPSSGCSATPGLGLSAPRNELPATTSFRSARPAARRQLRRRRGPAPALPGRCSPGTGAPARGRSPCAPCRRLR